MPSREALDTLMGDGTKIFLAGAYAGILSRTITAPVDRLKMLMQVHSHHRVL